MSSNMLPPAASRLLGLTLAIAWTVLASACGGSGSSEIQSPDAALVEPTPFSAVVDAPKTFVINVHTPDEGSIAGTDAEIPFDQLERRAAELPADRSTPLAVYCRSGNMSITASQTLADLGFTDITELAGGMLAWEAEGLTLLPPAAS